MSPYRLLRPEISSVTFNRISRGRQASLHRARGITPEQSQFQLDAWEKTRLHSRIDRYFAENDAERLERRTHAESGCESDT